MKDPTERIKELEEQVKHLTRYNTDQIQDRCENAYVEVSRWDAALQALSEVAPDHPLLKGSHPNYGVWTMQQKRIEELENELRQDEKPPFQ